jgi:hypothetical protein
VKEEILQNGRECKSGKRAVVKGKFILMDSNIVEAVERAEKETT